MTADIDRIVDRFGSPVAVVAGQRHEITGADLQQQVSDQTHIHARMYALLRLHVYYPRDLSVTTLRDTGPDGDFDITWRVIAVLNDHFTHAGFQDLEGSTLTIGAQKYPATRGTVPNDVDIELAALVAYIPEQTSSIVALAPPDQLNTIALDWL